jgi:hypothetical protein
MITTSTKIDLVVSISDLRAALANALEASRRNGGEAKGSDCITIKFPLVQHDNGPMIHTCDCRSASLSIAGANNPNPFSPKRLVWLKS